MDDDYYKTLGISRNATPEDIQKAYRKMARKYHPDMNPDDESAKKQFQDVQRAYEVLNDPEKREMYDRYGSSFESVGAGGAGGGAWRTQTGGGPQGFQDVDFSELFGGGYGGGGGGFDDIFRQFRQGGAGPRQAPRRPQRGADLRHEVTVPLRTIVQGGKVHLSVRQPSGKVEPIEVKIPAGLPEGRPLRVRGKGEPSPTGGEPGDILLTVKVEPHSHFSRHGDNLDVKLPITVSEAVLGGKVDVPTPHQTVSLTIPPMSSTGKRLRLKGQGIKRDSGESGDLYVELQIVLPPSMDDDSLELVRKLNEKQTFNPRSDLKW
ncbi:MAG: J domain-containing protein [Pirellulaceae bacterium]